MAVVSIRLAYAKWMLLKLVEHFHHEKVAIHVMYDIACSLHKHLTVSVNVCLCNVYAVELLKN